ncbi:MAG: methyltransferase [Paraprevotella sp.]|nr:methyltransferase [Paraprevotella sp.]
MSRTYFEFKQFTIHHDLCAMKVGTDGVLLGAWADVEHAQTVLDIGTGSGLLAIMTAQRSKAYITGIDIDTDAIKQARKNGELSPWNDRLLFQEADILTYSPQTTYDVIICNPPFFQKSLTCPDNKRTKARHAASLPLAELAKSVNKLLKEDGHFFAILPTEVGEEFINFCWEHGLNLHRKCKVHTKANKPAKRVLLDFKKGRTSYPVDTYISLLSDDGLLSPTWASLSKDFYLDK